MYENCSGKIGLSRQYSQHQTSGFRCVTNIRMTLCVQRALFSLRTDFISILGQYVQNQTYNFPPQMILFPNFPVSVTFFSSCPG